VTNAAVVIVALTLCGEAAGEARAGKMAVASVIWNRAGGVPERTAEVCVKPRQFSCWNGGKTPVVPDEAPSRTAYAECLRIAESQFGGTFKPTVHADHYHAVRVSPRWAKSMRYAGRIGRHVFYSSAKSEIAKGD
jgi:spore germination cell wall hydrolase CwlJ-like protein